MLANEADADINSSYEGKPIHIAAKHGRIEAIEILLKHLPNSTDSESLQGKTSLHLAIENEKLTAVKLLLEKGANVNIPNKENKISLHLAVEKNSLEMVDLLLAHDNININTQDLKLKTPLHIAIEKGNADIVQRLLENGALISLTDNENKKPIDIAKEKEHIEIVRLLSIPLLEDYAKELSTRPDNDRLSFFGYKVGDKKKAVEALKSVVCDYKNPDRLAIHQKILNDGPLKEIYTSLLPVIEKVSANYSSSTEKSTGQEMDIIISNSK